MIVVSILYYLIINGMVKENWKYRTEQDEAVIFCCNK